MSIQLTFLPETKEEQLEKKLEEMDRLHERTRKSQYQKIGNLTKEVQELKYKLDLLETAICKVENPYKKSYDSTMLV